MLAFGGVARAATSISGSLAFSCGIPFAGGTIDAFANPESTGSIECDQVVVDLEGFDSDGRHFALTGTSTRAARSPRPSPARPANPG